MFYIKAEDKFDGTVKMFKEKTEEEAKKLAAPLRRNFNIEIFEVKEPSIKTKLIKKFVLMEEIRTQGYFYGECCGVEDNIDHVPVGIFNKKPSDETIFFCVLNIAQKKFGKKIALTRNFEKYGRQSFCFFDNEGHWIDTYTYFVEEYSLISD